MSEEKKGMGLVAKIIIGFILALGGFAGAMYAYDGGVYFFYLIGLNPHPEGQAPEGPDDKKDKESKDASDEQNDYEMYKKQQEEEKKKK